MQGKMYSPNEIAEMYGVSLKTARRYMLAMGCETKPYRVSESALRKWKDKRLREPVDYQATSDRFTAAEKKIIFRFQRKG